MEFQQKIKKHKENGWTIIPIDESGFVRNMPRTHGYAIKGTRCYGMHDWHPSKVLSHLLKIVKNDNEAMLLSWVKIVIIYPIFYRCDRTSIFECNINTPVFNGWVKEDLIPKLPQKSVIVLDNAAFHKSPVLKNMVEEAGHKLEYLPAYSPDLNPIEPKWFQAKSRKRKYQCDIDTLFQKYMT